MGFGAIIASGDNNQLLDAELVECMTEVRVEQFLDQPTQFAIRFQEDIRDGEPFIMQASALQPEQMISIATQAKEQLLCLVRGPITEVKCSLTLGGQGSWVEVHGMDRRIELDRQCFCYTWPVKASEAAESILSAYKFKCDIQKTNKIYSKRSGTLNQRATDLAFINRIARQNNLCFWISYDCKLSGLDPFRQKLKITETANVKSSPPRPKGAVALPIPVDQIKLIPTTDLALRVNVDPVQQCQNVTGFQLEVDVERPNKFNGSAINDLSGKNDAIAAEDNQPAVKPKGKTITDLTKKDRQVCITSPGDSEELQPRAEALLTDAGWFLKATATSTAYMLGEVLMPHDVVNVEGLGKRHSGPYQVKSVTHVINAADHFMDLGLRRNALGGN